MWKKRWVLTLLLLLGTFAGAFYISNRQLKFEASGFHDRAIESAIQRTWANNIAAINSGDWDTYVSTIVPNHRQETTAKVKTVVQRRQVNIKSQSFQIERHEGIRATARVNQLQTKRREPGQGQALEETVTFIKRHGTWYIQQVKLVNAYAVAN